MLRSIRIPGLSRDLLTYKFWKEALHRLILVAMSVQWVSLDSQMAFRWHPSKDSAQCCGTQLGLKSHIGLIVANLCFSRHLKQSTEIPSTFVVSLKLDCFMQAVGIKEVSMADSEDEMSDSETEAANALRAKSRWEPCACIDQIKGLAGCCAEYIGP